MAVVDASPSHAESANLLQDADWAFSVQCCYNPLLHDACFSVAELHVWYFDNGASKHITYQQDIFSSLKSTLAGNTVMCANNSSYPVKGVGNIVVAATNCSTFTLLDALYVPGIKKNLL